MNVLYLHELESKLTYKKREILEKYASVIAPDLNYRSNLNTIEYLFDIYNDQNIDAIIGSGAGGFIGYYLSIILRIPSLLFNPALAYRNGIKQIVPSHLDNSLFEFTKELLRKEANVVKSGNMRIVLGIEDDEIKARDNLVFLSENMLNTNDYTIVLKKDMAHQIPYAVFEEEIKAFFESLKN